jgi:hypothetical protein
LKGRCYEFESVPYKGLDALIDELATYLQRLADSAVDALLPRDASLLPVLFPVLGRVKAIGKAPVRSAIVPDAQELRQKTFAALRELLARLSDRHSLVIWIDDLQWGDRDSSTFLAELCSPPDQPSSLLLLSYRSEELASNPTLHYLHQVLGDQRILGNWRQMVLEELTPNESRTLFRQLVPQGEIVSDSVETLAMAEAAGHPLFLQQLAHFTGSAQAHSEIRPNVDSQIGLRYVLQQRANALPPFAREVLEFICISTQPLARSVLFAAADGVAQRTALRP